MERQEVQVDEGISLIDIFRLFLSRIKFLILAVLIGCVLGSSLAVLTTHNVNYYGTSVTFFVNPKKADASGESTGINGTYSAPIMDSMIKQLNSEMFAEKLILNDEELPEKDIWGDTAAKNQTLNGLIDPAKEKLTALTEKETEIENKTEEKADKLLVLTEANNLLTEKNKALNESYELLNDEWYSEYLKNVKTNENGQLQSIFSPSFNEAVYIRLREDGTIAPNSKLATKYHAWTEARTAQENAENAKIDLQTEVDDLTETIKTLEKDLETAKKETNEAVNAALKEWRKTKKYREALSKYKKSVSFQYLLDTKDLEDTQYLSRNQIFVTISIKSNKTAEKDFAEDLFERVKTVVPSFVEENMTPIAGYDGTVCTRLTRLDEIRLTNPNYTLKSALKYGAVAGAAALVLACIVVILLDKSDKRLRDTEVITRKFNLPVLGVIPAIDFAATTGDEEKTSTEVR